MLFNIFSDCVVPERLQRVKTKLSNPLNRSNPFAVEKWKVQYIPKCTITSVYCIYMWNYFSVYLNGIYDMFNLSASFSIYNLLEIYHFLLKNRLYIELQADPYSSLKVKTNEGTNIIIINLWYTHAIRWNILSKYIYISCS